MSGLDSGDGWLRDAAAARERSLREPGAVPGSPHKCGRSWSLDHEFIIADFFAVEPAREGMASEVSDSSLRRLAQHNKTVLFALSARILRGSLIRRAAEDLWIDTSFGRTF